MPLAHTLQDSVRTAVGPVIAVGVSIFACGIRGLCSQKLRQEDVIYGEEAVRDALLVVLAQHSFMFSISVCPLGTYLNVAETYSLG